MSGKNSNWVTAADLLAELERDPDYQREDAEREAAFQRRGRELRADEDDMIRELRSVGLKVTSVGDLIDLGAGGLPSRAVAILIRHLGMDHETPTRSAIAEALRNSSAADRDQVKHALRRALAAEVDDAVRDSILLALGEVAGPDDLEDLVAMANDPATGDGRVLLLAALARYGEPGRAALVAARSDPLLGQEAARQLRAMTGIERKGRRPVGRVARELISVALDRDQLPTLLDALAEALDIAADRMRMTIAQVDAMRPDDSWSATLDGSEGRSVTLEVFLDDGDALDVVVRGPESFRSTVEHAVRDLPLDR